MLDLPWYKKWISYVYPVIITRRRNDTHANLKVKYFQGQLQLESDNALYSDGHRYTPFKMAYSYLNKKNKLKPVKRFLLLGSGLGSALDRLHKVYDIYPEAFLVEYDSDILALSQKYLLKDQNESVHFIRREAQDFLNASEDVFDLIGIDLFDSLENSYLITSGPFWQQVKKVMNSGTQVILNTIFTKKKALKDFENMLSKDFTFVCLKRIPNYIYVMQLKNTNG